MLGAPEDGHRGGVVPDEWPLRTEMRSERIFGYRLFRGVGERLSASMHCVYATRQSAVNRGEKRKRKRKRRGCEGTDKTKITDSQA